MKDPILQLTKAYKKRVKDLNKNFFTDKDIGLKLFVEQLKYQRDCILLQNSLEEMPADLTILITAIEEFEEYLLSIDTKQKDFHWKNFCEFIKLNREEWLASDDPVQESNNT